MQFNRSIKLLEIFSMVYHYSKEQKSFEARKEILQWQPLPAKNGFVENEELFLPKSIEQHPRLPHCDTITIVHDMPTADGYKKHFLFNDCLTLTAPRQFSIFDIKKKEEIELHLRYNYFFVGYPERKNYKLCDLRKQQSVEIKINGIIDFSLTGRRDRVFIDQQYVFNYVGDFKNCKFLPEKELCEIVSVPENRKLINLLKPLK